MCEKGGLYLRSGAERTAIARLPLQMGHVRHSARNTSALAPFLTPSPVLRPAHFLLELFSIPWVRLPRYIGVSIG
jgi:hypothetical protein